MRPTLRGWSCLAVVAASFAMAAQYGPRALNAVVTPILVVLVAGAVTTYRVRQPTVRRAPVAEGFVGERRTVDLEIETESAVSATVSDAVSDGLAVVDVEAESGTADVTGDGRPRIETTLSGEDRVSYEVRLEERGEHRLGPVTITVTDVLGLVKRRVPVDGDETGTILVYPPVRDLQGAPGEELRAFLETVADRDREEFDHLREYQRGDSLRDVHWKSAAKRPDTDLVVTEYVDDEETGSATITAEGTLERADELATAVASVATFLLEYGVDVGVSLPADGGDHDQNHDHNQDHNYPPGSGQDHHYDLLAALALLEGGELSDAERERADVLVRADADGTTVDLGGTPVPFERLTGGSERLRSSSTGHDQDPAMNADEPGREGEVNS